MSTELVYLMRTCAAALLDGREVPKYEIADIMTEASNLLEEQLREALGEPMALIPAAVSNAQSAARNPTATWGGNLPSIQPQPCPGCGAISARTAKRAGRSLMVTCPQCSKTWEYGK